jgi:signal transduction histidine kinase
MTRLLVPDEVLLGRFGLVRIAGGAAYTVAVAVLFALYGARVWPLLLGVPVLAAVTVWHVRRSPRAPRLTTVGSLAVDAVVLSGAAGLVGGTGSGTVMLHTIIIVSAGILLGPLAAAAFTGVGVLAGLGQLALEQLGVGPVVLARPELADRATILAISLGVVASVGVLTATYASRLHELVAEAGAEAEVVRRRGKRRRQLVRRASIDVAAPLRELDAVAEQLGASREWPDAWDAQARERVAARLRMSVARVDAEVGRLADLGVLDADADAPPQPLSLRRVITDCVVALGERLDSHTLAVEAPHEVKVLGDPRGARRVVLTLLENFVEHTPLGSHARVRLVATGSHGVMVLTDDGPGVPAERADSLFEAPEDRSAARVGLPLAAELCRQMGARCRYEPAANGGARFIVSFRLAPSAAPTADGEPGVSAPAKP